MSWMSKHATEHKKNLLDTMPIDDKSSALLNQNKGYGSQTPLTKGCAKSEGGSGCVKKRGSEYVIINNKKPGNQIWRSGFSSKEQANKVLAGYHANK